MSVKTIEEASTRHGVLPVISIAAGNRQTDLPLPPAIGKPPANVKRQKEATINWHFWRKSCLFTPNVNKHHNFAKIKPIQRC